MKVQIPEQLKAEAPANKWGKILTATPVVMAVVATLLAGLSSSEMSRAQYDRALGAQLQSKAGDQWSFFQAKRLRDALQRNALDLLQSTVELHPVTALAFRAACEQLPGQAEPAKADLLAVLGSPGGQQALSLLEQGRVPETGPAPPPDPSLKAALDAVESLKPEAEVRSLLTHASNQALDTALRAAQDRAQAFDAATKPINQAIDRVDELLNSSASAGQARPALPVSETAVARVGPSLVRDFTAARLRYASRRYEAEARLNQAIANLYELQVRKANMSAERHHARSQRFFFGMLGAQLGVIIATFAIAARQRNLLWSLAAAAGLIAIGFAIYVYLYI
jgi:hypothetical protein